MLASALMILGAFAAYTIAGYVCWSIHVYFGVAPRHDRDAHYMFGSVWPIGLLATLALLVLTLYDSARLKLRLRRACKDD